MNEMVKMCFLGTKEGLGWGQLGFGISALRRIEGGPMLQVLELHRRDHWLTSNVARRWSSAVGEILAFRIWSLDVLAKYVNQGLEGQTI